MEQVDTHDLNALSLADFAASLRRSGHIRRLIELARDEDLGNPVHDWTGELMFGPDDQRRVRVRARQVGVLAGITFMDDLLEVFDPSGTVKWKAALNDGDLIASGSVIAELWGNARMIVAIERTMLNLISRMSGIALLTGEFVSLIEGTNARICDTRKTTPGIRAFEKFAVRCGGGTTHRMGLYDAVLIKDNHLAGIAGADIPGKVESIVKQIRAQGTKLWFVQIEVDTLAQLEQVLKAKQGTVDIVLLDNMTNEQLSNAVALRDASKAAGGASPLLEASGGVSMDTVRSIAQCNVDRISIGGLTHQAQSLDIGLDAVE